MYNINFFTPCENAFCCPNVPIKQQIPSTSNDLWPIIRLANKSLEN